MGGVHPNGCPNRTLHSSGDAAWFFKIIVRRLSLYFNRNQHCFKIYFSAKLNIYTISFVQARTDRIQTSKGLSNGTVFTAFAAMEGVGTHFQVELSDSKNCNENTLCYLSRLILRHNFKLIYCYLIQTVDRAYKIINILHLKIIFFH